MAKSSKSSTCKQLKQIMKQTILIAIFLLFQFNQFIHANPIEASFGANSTNSEANQSDDDIKWTFPSEEDFAAAAKLEDDKFFKPNGSYGCTSRRQPRKAGDPVTQSNVWREQNKWPQPAQRQAIPVRIHPSYTQQEKSIIARAFQNFDKNTNGCIKFREATPQDRSYISISSGQGCSSPVGRVGVNQVSLNRQGCMRVAIAEHELLHSLGFDHEQSRLDRDQHVTILWDNIIPQAAHPNFDKGNPRDPSSRKDFGKYDYDSVMHYGANDFGKRGPNGPLMTIKTKDTSKQNVIGQRRGMSQQDIQKLKQLYNCK